MSVLGPGDHENEMFFNPNLSNQKRLLTDKELPIESENIADCAITTDKIADRSVTSEKIAEKAITGDAIGDAVITGTHIGKETITGDNIKSGSIRTTALSTEGLTSGSVLVSTSEGLAFQALGTENIEGLTNRLIRIEAAPIPVKQGAQGAPGGGGGGGIVLTPMQQYLLEKEELIDELTSNKVTDAERLHWNSKADGLHTHNSLSGLPFFYDINKLEDYEWLGSLPQYSKFGFFMTMPCDHEIYPGHSLGGVLTISSEAQGNPAYNTYIIQIHEGPFGQGMNEMWIKTHYSKWERVMTEKTTNRKVKSNLCIPLDLVHNWTPFVIEYLCTIELELDEIVYEIMYKERYGSLEFGLALVHSGYIFFENRYMYNFYIELVANVLNMSKYVLFYALLYNRFDPIVGRRDLHLPEKLSNNNIVYESIYEEVGINLRILNANLVKTETHIGLSPRRLLFLSTEPAVLKVTAGYITMEGIEISPISAPDAIINPIDWSYFCMPLIDYKKMEELGL